MNPIEGSSASPFPTAWTNIPLKVGDDIVGTATISANGGILATFSESPLGKSLYQLIMKGTLDHISIGPSLIPVIKEG